MGEQREASLEGVLEANLKILAFIQKTRKGCPWQVFFLCREGTLLEPCFAYVISGSNVEGACIGWSRDKKIEGQGRSPERADGA